MKKGFRLQPRRRQSASRFFLTALIVAVVIFVIAEIVQMHPWTRYSHRATPTSGTVAPSVPVDRLAGFQVFLRRGGCHGACPYYALKVGDGDLEYVGVRDVTKRGKITEPARQEEMRQLLKLVENASFFSLKDSYDLASPDCRAVRADAPTFTIGVTLNGKTKVVKANEGCTSVPKQLEALATGIDRVTRSARWTGIAPATATPPAGTSSP